MKKYLSWLVVISLFPVAVAHQWAMAFDLDQVRQIDTEALARAEREKCQADNRCKHKGARSANTRNTVISTVNRSTRNKNHGSITRASDSDSQVNLTISDSVNLDQAVVASQAGLGSVRGTVLPVLTEPINASIGATGILNPKGPQVDRMGF